MNDIRLVGAVAGAMLFGIGIGSLTYSAVESKLERNYKKKRKCEPGLYVSNSRVATILTAVGIHALKDGVYDTYELHEIIKNVKV